MPCSDNGWSESLARQEAIKLINDEKLAKETLYNFSSNNEKVMNYATQLRIRNDQLARMLCYVMNHLTKEGQEFICKKNWELKKWWEEHQEFDKSEGR